MKKFLLILTITLSFASIIASEFPRNELKDLRIVKLLPDISFPLAIEPAIPKNFIMKSVDKEPDLLSGVVWGEKKEAEAFLKNPEKNKSTVIVVRYSGNVSQESLLQNLDPLKDELSQSGFKDVELKRYNWGNYPVVALKATANTGKEIDLAWAGLNVDGGWVLLFNLNYPTSQSKPSASQLRMWNDFLQNSKQLPEREFLLLNGIDLEDNYTILAYQNAEVKAFAEERSDNQEALVVVAPLTPKTTFKIKSVAKTYLGTQWHYGEPCVKIQGEMTHESEHATDILDSTITVLLKSVNHFSHDLEKISRESTSVSWTGKLPDYEAIDHSTQLPEKTELKE